MQAVQFHAARLARRRQFLSAADAEAYDQGARAQRAGEPCPIDHTPEMSGWIDSEMAELDALEWAEGMAQ